MKAVAFLFLGLFALSTVEGNYLLQAYDDAKEMMTLYRSQSDAFGNYISQECADMGYYFTDLLADAAARATTAAQGEGIAYCARIIDYLSRSNVDYVAAYVLATGRASDRLHQTVLDLLRTMNIKEYDAELFYYYHGYVMEEAFDLLWDHYYSNMYLAWYNMFLEFDYNYMELYECLQNALYN